jgi:hypothetical protein
MALESLAQAIARLERRGFLHSLRARCGELRAAGSGESFAPEDLEIDEIVRFEGDTDPAEEVALFALRGPDGAPYGTYASMYGPATPPEDAAVVRRLRGARSRRFASYAGPQPGKT